MSIHIDSIAKKIRKTLNGRGSSRFQMQIPYGRSAIIFLQCKNNPSLSTLWTNLLLHIILADLKSSRPGHVFFPQNAVEQNNMLIHELDTFFEQQTSLSSEQFQQMLTKSKRKNTWGDGLVSLPTIFNIDKKTREGIDGSREARVPTRAILRLMATDVSHNTLPTTSIQKLDQLIDTVKQDKLMLAILALTRHIAGKNTPSLYWDGPINIPNGGIVVWHSFHTTRGNAVKNCQPEATVFLDYTERSIFEAPLLEQYRNRLLGAPFDAGSGSINTRSGRPTHEFNVFKNYANVLPISDDVKNHKIVGGNESEDEKVGTFEFKDEKTLDFKTVVLQKGYGIIVPVSPTTTKKELNEYRSKGYCLWHMTDRDKQAYNQTHENTLKEFEEFLTYIIFEREFIWLTGLLMHHGPENLRKIFGNIFNRLFQGGKVQVWNEDNTINVNILSKKEYDMVFAFYEKNEHKNEEVLNTMKKISPELLTDSLLITFHLRAWILLCKNGKNIKIRGGDTMSICWDAVFGNNTIASKWSYQYFGDAYFINWRMGVGNQRHGMGYADSKDALKRFFLTAVRQVNAMKVLRHSRNAQGGGTKLARDSGMGGATSFFHGKAHVGLQVGKFGRQLAQTFYQNPLVVLERFRIKRSAPWGAGHIDHSVASRISILTKIYGT